MTSLARSQPGSLPLVLLRHGSGLLAGVLLLALVAGQSPSGDQPILWLAAAAVAGAVSGLLDRGWMGLLFVAVGLALGIAFDVATRHHSTTEAAEAFASAAPLYLAVLLGGAAAYVILRMVRRQLS